MILSLSDKDIFFFFWLSFYNNTVSRVVAALPVSPNDFYVSKDTCVAETLYVAEFRQL